MKSAVGDLANSQPGDFEGRAALSCLLRTFNAILFDLRRLIGGS